MPQFDNHPFLNLQSGKAEAHEFVFALVANWKNDWYPVGSACLIEPNLLVTAKHVLAYMIEEIAGQKIEKYDMFGIRLPAKRLKMPDGMGLDALEFIDDRGDARRFGVTGCFEIGAEGEECDLAILQIVPHPSCPNRSKPLTNKIPKLDLIPPMKGRPVHGFGYPDHPNFPRIACDGFLSQNHLYHSSGAVEQVNFQPGSSSIVSFQTSMPTISGMSGGPVFVEKDNVKTFCGVIGKGDEKTYSLISPLWQLAWTAIDHRPGLPNRHGFTMVYDLLKTNQIKNIGSEYLNINEETLSVSFDFKQLLENGH